MEIIKGLINGGVAKQLGNRYTKFDSHAMFTKGENKSLLNCLQLGSYADKHIPALHWGISNEDTAWKAYLESAHKNNTAISSISIQTYISTPAFRIMEVLQIVSLIVTVVEGGWLRSNMPIQA